MMPSLCSETIQSTELYSFSFSHPKCFDNSTHRTQTDNQLHPITLKLQTKILCSPSMCEQFHGTKVKNSIINTITEN